MTAQVGVKNGRLTLFYPPGASPSRVTELDRQRVQVIRGGLRRTLLPLGVSLLQRAGVQRGDAFVLVLDNDRTSVACMLAAMELACVCVVVGKSRIALLAHVQEQTGITNVVVVDNATESATAQAASTDAHNVAPAWIQDAAIVAGGGAVGLLTSGSIGDPKVVVCTWERMLLQGQSTHEQLFPHTSARIVCATSIAHAYSINAVFTLFTSPFDAESELCFAPTIGGLQTLLSEPKHKFTLLYGTPATYTALLDLPPVPLHVDVPYCAGTRLQLELFDNVAAHCGLRLMQNYGSTETGDIAAWSLHGKQFDDEQREMRATRDFVYVGSLWPGVRVQLVRETSEVLVSTPWQALGYVCERALQGFNGAPHRTADVGRTARDASGVECLWLQDRLRPSVETVSGGIATSHPPTLIEAAVVAHPDVTDALVLMQKRSVSAGAVRLRAVLRDDASVCADDLVAWCAQRFPGLRNDLAIELVECLPCSPAGKLLYS